MEKIYNSILYLFSYCHGRITTAILFSREKDRTQKSRAFHARVLLRKTLKTNYYFMLILPRSHNPVLRRSRKPMPKGTPGSNPGRGVTKRSRGMITNERKRSDSTCPRRKEFFTDLTIAKIYKS